MALKENDFVELDYTGRLKEDNFIFDTTDKAVAEKNGIKSGDFGKIIVCLGKGHLLKGLEDSLVGRDLGKHTIELSAENAFGKKNVKLIHLVPTKNFLVQKIKPEPGLQVNIDGNLGVVKTVSGGRTIVDFNHPLAGKDVVYEVNVHRLVSDKAEQLNALCRILLRVNDAKVEVKENAATVRLAKELPKEIAEPVAKEFSSITGLKKVEFLKA